MLTEVKRAMHELSENFNTEKKYKKVYKEIIELQNTSELKSSIEGFNNRQDQTEGKINEL